ncbi:hypothetical protein Z043_116340, partial [Scleropages formosus]
LWHCAFWVIRQWQFVPDLLSNRIISDDCRSVTRNTGRGSSCPRALPPRASALREHEDRACQWEQRRVHSHTDIGDRHRALTMMSVLLLLLVFLLCEAPLVSLSPDRQQRSRRGLLELAGVIRCSTGRSALAYMAYGCYCGLGGQGWPRDQTDWSSSYSPEWSVLCTIFKIKKMIL